MGNGAGCRIGGMGFALGSAESPWLSCAGHSGRTIAINAISGRKFDRAILGLDYHFPGQRIAARTTPELSTGSQNRRTLSGYSVYQPIMIG